MRNAARYYTNRRTKVHKEDKSDLEALTEYLETVAKKREGRVWRELQETQRWLKSL